MDKTKIRVPRVYYRTPYLWRFVNKCEECPKYRCAHSRNPEEIPDNCPLLPTDAEYYPDPAH